LKDPETLVKYCLQSVGALIEDKLLLTVSKMSKSSKSIKISKMRLVR
jgi:hypothetical protein